MTNHPNRSKKEIAVVVTTEYKGVFFGYALESEIDADIIPLRRARNCVYWSPDIKGFEGLATGGPTRNCKIGPAASEIRLRKITSVLLCSDDAAKAWEQAPWGR